MTEVEIQFSNIQSHEFTNFKIKPGMNFIISQSNNVGKSTIFITLSTIAKMPNTSLDDFSDLLRDNANLGYAMFKYQIAEEHEKVILWLSRDGEHVRGFIEHYLGEVPMRLVAPPSSFYHALGIRRLVNGDALNIIDANSTQLFVDAGRTSDAIIEEILLDRDVEHIKENLDTLTKTAVSNIKDFNFNLSFTLDALNNCTYNDNVDLFFDEISYLEKLAKAADDLQELGKITNSPNLLDKISLEDFNRDMVAVETAISLEPLTKLDFKTINQNIDIETFIQFKNIFEFMYSLNQVINSTSVIEHCNNTLNVDIKGKKTYIMEVMLNIQQTLTMLKQLLNAVICCSEIVKIETELQRLYKEKFEVENYLKSNFKVVNCPVRGEVYYGEKCIPCNN